ncbi:MAG: alpha/beta hydrolase [Deltaproteobacteria bacterium]|nr:alpha/beta hydrolase [Deltaproteobacteria bacterium]
MNQQDVHQGINKMKRANQSSVGLILLHGAGLGSWIWDDLEEKLEYPFLSIDLPGRGKHKNIATKDLSLENYAQSVVSEIYQFNAEKLIIVAHSIGGVVGLEVSHLLQSRIGGFVAISATIPAASGSYISTLPFLTGIFLRSMFIFAGTRPPSPVLRKSLCDDLNEKQTVEIIERFVPESKKLYIDKRNSQDVPVNSLYVRLKDDKALGVPIQNRMITNLNAKQIIDIDSGHLPMLSKTDELARILNTFASKIK